MLCHLRESQHDISEGAPASIEGVEACPVVLKRSLAAHIHGPVHPGAVLHLKPLQGLDLRRAVIVVNDIGVLPLAHSHEEVTFEVAPSSEDNSA